MRPLASGLLLQAGHNEIRAHAFPMKVWGTKPAFLHRAYGMLIHCFVITIANLAIEPEASGKGGISAFVATHLLEAPTKTVLQIDFRSVAMSGTVSILALRGSAPRRSRNLGKPRRAPNRACHLRHDHVDVYPWLSILAARWSPWLVAAAVFGARVWRPHQPDRSGGGHGYAQNVKAPEVSRSRCRASHSSTRCRHCRFHDPAGLRRRRSMRGRGPIRQLPASRQNRSDLGVPYQLVSDNSLVDLDGES